MSILCIAGTGKFDLQSVYDLLHSAGMAAAKPLARDPSITFEWWHQKLSAQNTGHESDSQPSRIWEQVGVDLMLANMDNPLWGWADTRAADTLQFWSGLDNSIRFVLLCQTPHQAVAEMVSAEDGAVSVEQALGLWQRHHQAALRFHLRNPQKSALVWADEALAQPEALVNQFNTQWQLGLGKPEQLEVGDASGRALLQSALANVIAIPPDAAELLRELQSTLVPLVRTKSGSGNTQAMSAQTMISHFRQMQDRSKEAAALQGLREQLQEVAAARESAQEQVGQLNDLVSRLESEIRSKDEIVRNLRQDIEVVKVNQAELAKSKELAEKEKASISAQLKEVQQESDLLLQQLHQVQEELEKYFLQHRDAQAEIKKLTDRWSQLVRSQPALADFGAVELLSDGSDGQPMSWQINNTTLANRTIKKLQFKTIIENGVAGFILGREGKDGAGLIRWPLSAKSENQVTIIPVGTGPEAKTRASHLVQLSTSDLRLVLAIPDLLKRAILRGHVPGDKSRLQVLMNALAAFAEIIQNLKSVVRFDKVLARGQQNTPQRNVLALRLENVLQGGKQIPAFEFQLQLNKNAQGSVDSAYLLFDQSTSNAPFDHWAANVPSKGDQSIMAVQLNRSGWSEAIWNTFSDADRQFVLALIDSLSIIFVALQSEGARTDRPWKEWNAGVPELRTWARKQPSQWMPAAKAKAEDADETEMPHEVEAPQAPVSRQKAKSKNTAGETSQKAVKAAPKSATAGNNKPRNAKGRSV